MSSQARFLGKVFICRDGNWNDPYVLDGIGGTHIHFNLYANGRNEGADFTGVTCQCVEPVTGAGKPSDLTHLTHGAARPGEPGANGPLVAGADHDTRLFGIDLTNDPPLFTAHFNVDMPLPGLPPRLAALADKLRHQHPDWFLKLLPKYVGDFGCRSTFMFGNIQWWWGVGWLPDFPDPYLRHNRPTLFWLTPSADDWRTGKHVDTRPYGFKATTDYEWCDLSGEDYSHLSLPNARFGNADLTATDFTGSDLTNADFHAVHSLKHAKLTNAKLDGANLNGVDLEGTDLSGASLIGADLSNTDLTKAIVNAAPTLSHDINKRTSFAHSTVPWKALHDANRDGNTIDLTALVLAFAHLPDAPEVLHGLDASDADVRGVVLANRDLRSAKFVHAHAEAIDLSGSMLVNASFRSAFLGSVDNLPAASLANANLMDADFSDADLTGTVLTGAYLWGSGAKLDNATLVQTNFSGAYLAAANFRAIAGNQCSGVDFSGACLVNADFTGTTTQKFGGAPTNFVNACLQGANFDRAHLIDTTLFNATVSFDSGTFEATVLMRWPPEKKKVPTIRYDATKGLDSATTATTTCPLAGPGPCTPDQLKIANPVTHWPPTG